MDALQTITPCKKNPYFRNPTFSDITIRYGTQGEKTIPGHRAIICAESVWFSKACEGQFQEASSRELTLRDDDPVALEAMFEFCYKGDYTHYEYDVRKFLNKDNSFILDRHLGLLIVADKYTVIELSGLVQDRIYKIMEHAEFEVTIYIMESIYDTDHPALEALKDKVVTRVARMWNDHVGYRRTQDLTAFKPDQLVPLIEKYPIFAAELCKRAAAVMF